MNESTKQSILSVGRSLLIAAIAWATGKGYITEAVGTDLLGAMMVIAAAALGVWNAISSEKKTAAREVVAVNVGIVKADNTVGPTPLETKESAPDTIEAIAPAVPKPS